MVLISDDDLSIEEFEKLRDVGDSQEGIYTNINNKLFEKVDEFKDDRKWKPIRQSFERELSVKEVIKNLL